MPTRIKCSRPYLWAVFLYSLFSTLYSPCLQAQILLDTELTLGLQQLARPVQKFMPGTTHAQFVVVADDTLNAYVDARGLIHIHSGLIAQAGSAAELQGVLAHELGHVQAQHVQQLQTTAQRSLFGALGGALLGIGAAAAGAPQAGVAIAMGSQAAGLSNILQFSRTHEHEADRLALTALHQAGLSGAPMLDLFTQLRTDTQLSFKVPPPYLLTHPLPAQRIANLQQAVAKETSTLPAVALAKEGTFTAAQWARFQAKTYALTHTPAATLRKYTDTKNPSHTYARAIAYALQGKTAQAQALMADLQKSAPNDPPNDPFYIEISAYLAQDAGDLATATQLFTQVVSQHPSFSFTRYALAQNLMAQANPQAALPHLQQVTREWPWWPAPWQSLGIVYGQLGQLANSHLAITEGHLVLRQRLEAEQQLALATHYLKQAPNTPATQRAQQWADSLQTQLQSLK